MKCSYCNKQVKYSQIYCPYCKNKIIIKKKKKWFILLIYILVLLTYFLLNYEVKITVPVKKIVSEPVEIIREVNISYESSSPVCTEKSYRFSISSGLIQTIGSSVKPDLTITNQEERWGTYSVNFSYISDSDYPESKYGGENLREMLDTGRISLLDAEFFSENYYFLLGPGESVRIQNNTPAPDRNKYWAIASIREPTYTYCYEKKETRKVLENKTFFQDKEVEKTVKVKQYRELKEIINISDFRQWFVIVTLLMIILYLLIEISEERKIVIRFKR